MNCAPITLFVYKRPWHTRQTIEALQRNELATESDLIVYADGPKDEAADGGVREVREYIRTIDGFRSVHVVEREKNLGLARSIISGVTEVVARHGRIIVLEDDMVTSRFFLRYMNEALELYRNDEEVISIHGYCYPVAARLPETFFLWGADCWGWGTWKRGWNLFEPDSHKLLDELSAKKLTRRFDFGGSYRYTEMLADQVAGRIDSWAIRWYASAFLKNRLTLYPGRSLVRNTGMDESGTHGDATDLFATEVSPRPVTVERIPLKEKAGARRAIAKFFRSLDPEPSFFQRAMERIGRALEKP